MKRQPHEQSGNKLAKITEKQFLKEEKCEIHIL